MHIYSHLSLVVANQSTTMGLNDRLEGCVVEVAGCNPVGQLEVPDAVVAFYMEVLFRKRFESNGRVVKLPRKIWPFC